MYTSQQARNGVFRHMAESLPITMKHIRVGVSIFCISSVMLTIGGCFTHDSHRNASSLQPVRYTPNATTADETTIQFATRELTTVPRQLTFNPQPRGAVPDFTDTAPHGQAANLPLRSRSILIMDQNNNVVYAKGTKEQRPIASLTKIMTAMVVMDAGVPMNTQITISDQDIDMLRHSHSRLAANRATLTRNQLLRAALISSDNRAAHALGRTTFSGGRAEFVRKMNQKARALGMNHTVFYDTSGLDGRNQSNVEDIMKMLKAAGRYRTITAIASIPETQLTPYSNGASLVFRNSNPLVRDPQWQVMLSKTGYLNEAGRCLMMRTRINNKTYDMVMLGGPTKLAPMQDARIVRNWAQGQNNNPLQIRTARAF